MLLLIDTPWLSVTLCDTRNWPLCSQQINIPRFLAAKITLSWLHQYINCDIDVKNELEYLNLIYAKKKYRVHT